MASHGQLYNPFRAQNTDVFVTFPDVLGGEQAEEVPSRLSEGFTEHLPRQGWKAGASYFESGRDEIDLVETSFDTSLEEEERVDLSFSSPERNSFFPKVGTTQDSYWSPERSLTLDEESPAKVDFAVGANTAPVYQATSPCDTVSIVMEERLSILFDGISSEPTCRVIGRIYVCDADSLELAIHTFFLTTVLYGIM
jgi:hypothetical protein